MVGKSWLRWGFSFHPYPQQPLEVFPKRRSSRNYATKCPKVFSHQRNWSGKNGSPLKTGSVSKHVLAWIFSWMEKWNAEILSDILPERLRGFKPGGEFEFTETAITVNPSSKEN